MIGQMEIVFLILLATTVCFAIPKFRSDLVALCSLLALFLSGVINIEQALAGFSSTVVVMLAVLFIVGEGISQTGLAGKAGTLLVKLTGNSEFRMLVFVKLLVAVIGSFVSNTGTVAILMPIVVSLSIKMNIHPGKLLMPLAFGASMGGALTLIGTAPNLLARDALINSEMDIPVLSFFDFTPIGLIILVVGTAYMWFVGRKLLDRPYEEKSKVADTVNVSELLRQYGTDGNLHYVQIPAGHEILGKTLKELKWPGDYHVTVLKVQKKSSRRVSLVDWVSKSGQELATPSYVLEAEDILLLYAEADALQRLLAETGLETTSRDLVEGLQIEESNIAEVILTPQSNFIRQTLKDIHFRDKFGLTVLAIKHRQESPATIDDELHYGDAMLVYGKWKNIDVLAKERNDLVVIRHLTTPPETAFNPVRAVLAGGILLAMIIMLVTEIIPAVITVLIAGFLMIVTGSVGGAERAYRAVNWQIVVLIACMLPMATALENTGGVAFIADGITEALGGAGPIGIMVGLYVVTSLFGVFISNTATAVLFLPVAILAAQYIGVSPFPFVMAVTYAASMSFSTPVSTPPNAMVMVAGKYNFLDYMKVGIPLQFIVGVVIILLLPLFFPF